MHDPTADAVNGAFCSPLHMVHDIARGLDPAVGSYPIPSRTAVPAGVQTSTMAMRFCVRALVLSVQMYVVAPSVSTASSCRTRALRSAISDAPRANDKVTVGSSPSGTSATLTPTPNRKALVASSPSARPAPASNVP